MIKGGIDLVSITEKAMKAIFIFCGLAIILFLVGILYILLSNSMPGLIELGLGPFFSAEGWNPGAYGEPSYSLINMIYGTLMVTLGALIFAVPLGVAAAAYLAEIASPCER